MPAAFGGPGGLRAAWRCRRADVGMTTSARLVDEWLKKEMVSRARFVEDDEAMGKRVPAPDALSETSASANRRQASKELALRVGSCAPRWTSAFAMIGSRGEAKPPRE
jgi:hypothetical protein